MKAGVSAVLASALVMLAWVAPAAAQSDQTRSCGWAVVVSGTQANILFPDEAATYWSANLPIPQGGYIEVHGSFPHARYTSLTTYTSQFQAIDGLNDTAIVPDPGSTNPFLVGADRTAAKRDYTVRIVSGQVPPSGRAPNTIYTTSADGSKSGGAATQRFVLRIYEGDRGQGPEGGVPLPQITLVSADGQRTAIPQCPDTAVPDLGSRQAVANSGSGEPTGVDTGRGGTNPPVWHKFTNFVSSILWVNQFDGSTTDGTLPDGGFAENPDNKYVFTTFTQDYGEVLAFRAKAPTTPATYDGEKRMGTGQLRYWSFCTNAQATAYYACHQDDQIPVDKKRFYTVVVSTAAARPRNATETCGITWLPAGPVPQSILILRNMLPAPTFAQAIQNIKPGAEEQGMGDYYPRGTYYATTADFEKLGCPAAR
jgi:hypothetical protein